VSVVVYEHPLSPYAQKVKIALEEKGVPFDARMPEAIGSGRTGGEFARANPRGEVPVLLDGGVALFDSSVILAYVEERWPEPALFPADPVARARVRTIEEVMDTHYEANTWALGEIRAFGRATGDRAARLEARAQRELALWHRWLDARLGGAEWFGGERFGAPDLCVAPFVNGAAGWGYPPEPGSALADWHARVNRRQSVANAARAAVEASAASSGAGLDAVRQLLEQGLFKREYRDHRLEWMVKQGGLDIVAEGIEKSNVRFVDPPE